MTEYTRGYKDALDSVVDIIDNTISNSELIKDLPTVWVLQILKTSLLTNDED